MRKAHVASGDPGYHPLRKLRIILVGLRFAVLYDFSVLYKVVLSAVILVASISFHAWLDTAVIILATGFALCAELFNTALEALCDFVEEREDQRIRRIKDIAAAAAGIAIFSWAVVLIASGLQLSRRFIA